MKKVNPEIWVRLMTQKLTLKILRNQHNPMRVSKSAVAISKLTDEPLRNKNNKMFSTREYKQS